MKTPPREEGRVGAAETVAVLSSGGLDSAVLLRESCKSGVPVLPIYVRTGHIWEAAELHWMNELLATPELHAAAQLEVLALPVDDLYGSHWSVSGRGVPGYDGSIDSNYLPGRNLLLLAKTSILCALRGISRIAMAPLEDNPFPDGTTEFFDAFARAAAIGLARPLSIEVPFRGLSKADVVRRAGDFPFELTFSCIQPRGIEHCGECTKCAERQRGFADAGVKDSTSYAVRRQ